MKVDIQTDEPLGGLPEDMVGNVYQVRGGKGAQLGHMHLIISAYEIKARWAYDAGFVTLTVDRDGQIVGANSYAHHYFMEKVPIARCDGIEDIHLVVRSL